MAQAKVIAPAVGPAAYYDEKTGFNLVELSKHARFPQLVGAAIACRYPTPGVALSESQIRAIMNIAFIEIGIKKAPSGDLCELQKMLALVARVEAMRASVDSFSAGSEYMLVRNVLTWTQSTDLETVRKMAIDLFRRANKGVFMFDPDVFPYTIHKLLCPVDYKNQADRLGTYYDVHQLKSCEIDAFNLFRMRDQCGAYTEFLEVAGRSCHTFILSMIKGTFKAYYMMFVGSTVEYAECVAQLGRFNPHCDLCRISECPLFKPHDDGEWFSLLGQKW